MDMTLSLAGICNGVHRAYFMRCQISLISGTDGWDGCLEIVGSLFITLYSATVLHLTLYPSSLLYRCFLYRHIYDVQVEFRHFQIFKWLKTAKGMMRWSVTDLHISGCFCTEESCCLGFHAVACLLFMFLHVDPEQQCVGQGGSALDVLYLPRLQPCTA